MCETHAAEISELGYCSNHRKLAELQDMCEDCSSSSRPDYCELSKKIAFIPWVKQIGMIQSDGEKIVENGEVNLRCSCCDVSLNSKFYSPYFLIKPSWGVLDYTQKGNLITETGIDDGIDEVDNSDRSRSDFAADRCEEDEGTNGNKGNQILSDVDASSGTREEEAEEDCSYSVSNFGCRETMASEDDKVQMIVEKAQEPIKEEGTKEEGGNFCIEDPFCDGNSSRVCAEEDASIKIPPQHLEYYVDRDDFRLVPVELIDFTAADIQNGYRTEDVGQANWDRREVILGSEFGAEAQIESIMENKCSQGKPVAVEFCAHETKEEPELEFALVESMEIDENENSSTLRGEEGDLVWEVYQPVAITQATQTPFNDVVDVQETDAAAGGEKISETNPASVEVFRMRIDETEVEILIGTEMPDQAPTDKIRAQEILPSDPCIQEDPSTSSANLYADDDHCSEQAEEETLECKTMTVEMSEQAINTHLLCTELNEIEDEIEEAKVPNSPASIEGPTPAEEETLQCKTILVETSEQAIDTHFSTCLELNEIEEERVPDTPTSIDGLNHLHKRLLLLEKRESGTEESLDGSVISEFEGGDVGLTVEKLKSALRSERKASSVLYAELEEERSASAVAANQTMAMINRLQEEKAAMQMEALQYQRMMEEQSEYDQEALQLLNELMIKREKEKQELEKELEIYRKKVLDYEAREKMMLRRMKEGSARSRTSSASCSNAEDSDGLSVELNHEEKEEDSLHGFRESGDHNTPADAVLSLEESLATFEEERLSILEQLKVLEEKLFTLADEEEHDPNNMKPIQHSYEENCKDFDENCDHSPEVNGLGNGFSKDMNGKHHQERRISGPKAKRLLPLFDAIVAETEDGLLDGNDIVFDSFLLQDSSVTKFDIESKKNAIEEEVDNLYERLQALEADREFLKHCISSLNKGDKGMDLLQEILQHLRDLRSVELRVRNFSDGALV